MKKLICYLFTLLFSFAINIPAVISQPFEFFDTIRVFKQSDNFDYTRPVFDNFIDNLFNNSNKAAYLKSGTLSSGIYITSFNYNSDLMEYEVVTDTSDKSFFSLSSNMVVWHSNLNGNYDIFFSIFGGSGYSPPAQITTSAGDDLNPKVLMTGTAACVVFERDSNIYAAFYQNGNWGTEINITPDLSDNCFSPVIAAGYSKGIAYSGKSASGSKNYFHSLSFSNSSSSIGSRNQYYTTAGNLNTASGSKGQYTSAAFDLYQSGQYSAYEYIRDHGQTYQIGNSYPGDKKNARISRFGILVDDLSGTLDTYYSFLNRRNDSLFLIASDNYEAVFFRTRSFYLGSDMNTSHDLSNPVFNAVYAYRIRIIWTGKLNGRFALFESNAYDALASLQQTAASTPSEYKLNQNYPNPFNPATSISFNIPEAADVRLTVYDALGRQSALLVNQRLDAGSYSYDFNAGDFSGGVYFYKLESGGFTETKRMVLLK